MMTRTRGKDTIILGCGVLLLACGGAPDPGVTTTGTGGGTGSTGVPTTGGGGSDGSSTQSATENSTAALDASGDEGGVFIKDPDGGLLECNPWQQDCPEGQKCALWASDGGNQWNDVRCVPVTGDAQPDEPCTVQESAFSGLDDCQEGAFCWKVDAELHGVCVALCNVLEGEPVCADEQHTCTLSSDIFNFCEPSCDPLAQDCPGADLCLPGDDGFLCILDASGDAGAAFDPCEFANVCDPGLICADAAAATECDPRALGCCTPMCALDDPDFVCPGVGQSCVPLYEGDRMPPQFANIGYCTVPE